MTETTGFASPEVATSHRRPLILLLVLLSATSASTVASASSAGKGSSACGVRAYSYAGVAAWRTADGVAATLELREQPEIEHGHVAAWVGVGGVGMGAGGRNEWLQAGVAAVNGTNELYYEVEKPNVPPRYHDLGVAFRLGDRHRVAVTEIRQDPNWWRIWIDRTAVSRPIFLPASHDRWPPVVTSESWNGGVGACNSFEYGFSTIRVRHDSWKLLSDAYPIRTPGYSVDWHPGTLIATGGMRAPLAVSP